jgi:carbon-monoxide dehydrogenase medium subunit
MKPASFDYASPRSVAEAVSLLEAGGADAKLLAGGQSLMPLLAMRLARPALLVDLGRVEGLGHLREESGELAIGAMATKRSVERSPLVRARQPLLHAATLLVGHPQIRNRGTVGGSFAHADPAAEYPAAGVVLGARLRVAGPGGERTLDAADFFLGPLTTALGPADVLVEVRVPALARKTGWSIQEFARRAGDFALAGAAATLRLDARGRVEEACLVLFGTGAAPARAREAEAVLAGERPEAAALAEAAARAAAALEEPVSDLHATGEFRRHLAGVMARRALAEAAARAGAAA